MTQSEQALIARLNQGDKAALEQLFKKYYTYLCAYSARFVDSSELSEEIVQEVFVKLWEKRQDIVIRSSIKSYLFKSVHNFAINQYHQQKVRDNYKSTYEEPAMFDEVHELLIGQELEAGLQKAMRKLPEKRREIFELSRIQGLKYKEIADQLNISIKTVEGQISKALIQIRKSLKDYL
ncbi:MAG: RNA polymerase sigma-70 factor [Bacteroidales bacterium]|nr:RNA polymerase sigma-70 factor [Bacteroidales bacterium]